MATAGGKRLTLMCDRQPILSVRLTAWECQQAVDGVNYYDSS